MFAKSSIIASLLASASSILASPTRLERAVGPSVSFINHTPNEIEYALVGPGGVVSQGSVPAAPNVILTLPVPPSGQGYSLKLAPQGHNPQSSSGILQFEYSSSTDGHLGYDWSALNGNPDPFSQFVRSIVPPKPSGACQPITCSAGQDNTMCESTSAGQGPVHVCPIINASIVTVTIG